MGAVGDVAGRCRDGRRDVRLEQSQRAVRLGGGELDERQRLR